MNVKNWLKQKNQKGFIQIPLLIVIIAGILIFGGVGYSGVKKYQSYRSEKDLKETEALVSVEAQKKAFEDARAEIQKLKEESLAAQEKQSTLEREVQATKQAQEKDKKPTASAVATFPKIVPRAPILQTIVPSPILQVLTSEEIYSKVSPSVVLIKASEGNGSGFIVNDGKYTITNAHVVGSDKTVQLQFQNGVSFDGIVLGKNDPKDLALIFNKIPPYGYGSQNSQAVKFGSSDSSSLKIGSDVFALGFPLSISEGLSAITFTKGTLSARQNVIWYSGGTLLQTDAATNHGNSGGPLVNNKGEVVGVTTFGLNNEAQGIYFAVPIQTLVDLIPQLSQYGQSRYELYPIGSTMTIKKSMIIPIEYNNVFSCEALGFVNGDLTTCNFFKKYHDDYNWNIIEDAHGF